MKRRLCSRLIAALIALACLLPCAVSVRAEEDPIYDITLDSQGVYLMNVETGTVLYEKNARLRMFPASLTKILTAMLVLEKCQDLEGTMITVPNETMFTAIIEDGAVHMDLRQGESFSVKSLLLGMMLNSFCDAAELLAWRFGGESTSRFVDMMNEKAAEIGMEDSHFANAHGLHDPEHWSSPRDLALLLKTAVEDPRFEALISARTGVIPATDFHDTRYLRYTVSIFYPENEYYLEAFVGGKSGFTDQAGRCLAAFSRQDGVSYVSIMLGANMDASRKYGGQNMAWIETSTLLSYVYENYSLQTLLTRDQKMAEIAVIDSETTLPVVAGEDVILLARNGAEPTYRLDLPEEISVTEVEDGALVGRVTLTLGEDGPETSCPLLLEWDGSPIPTKSFLEKESIKAGEAVKRIFKEDRTFVILMIILLAAVVISIPALKLTQYLRKRRGKPKH